MPELLDLQNRHIRLKSSLPKDGEAEALYFLTMIKTEQLGRLFVMELECISNDHHITLKDCLGKAMTIELDLPEGSDDVRYFHGLVTEFSYLGHFEGFAHYKAILRPWPWFLSRKQDSRIFQEMTAVEIIEQVFNENSGDFRRNLRGTTRKRVYTVQYRESDFNFVSRLMEEEGIYYYFEHEKNKHILVLSNDRSSHRSFPGYDELLYFPAEPDYRRKEDHIWNWTIDEEVQSGKFVLDDYDFVKPSADLKAQSAMLGYEHSDLEVFDYPGLYTEVSDGEGYARVRMEEHSALQEQLQGEGNARGLAVGHLFILDEKAAPNWRKDQNREYLITSATHVLRLELSTEQEDSYEIRFTAIDAKVRFRPQRITPKPTVRGIQTAVVCGKKGEEIWTDKYGRVKVQFHWDRQGKKNENSSCWIRVAQLWAGQNWGAMFIPRMGQEVVVDFLEGDPDRPLIIGRVYNEELMPPYTLPAEMTKSTIKSRSTKEGKPDNFNELRFEDKIGEEEIYFHAEKDFNRVVENNDTLKVGYDDKDKGDRTIGINHDRTTTIGNNDTLKVGYKLDEEGDKYHGKGDKEDGDQTIEIYKDRKTTLETGSETLTIEVDRTTTLNTGSETVTIEVDRTTTLNTGDDKLEVKAGKRYVKARQEIKLEVGASKITMSPTEIKIESTMITVKATGTLKLESQMSELKGTGILTLSGGLIKIN